VQSPSALELVSIEPSSFKPGEKIGMTFKIANEGNNQISNIIFTWSSTGNTILPLGSDNRVIIPAIGAKSDYSIPVEIVVSPSATPGIYTLGATLQYSDLSGAIQNISSTTGVLIGGETDFDVSLQESAANAISLTVANIGVDPATSIAVRIPQQDAFPITGATSVFLGNLNSGEYTMASFQVASRNTTTRLPGAGNFSSNRNATGRGITASNVLTIEISYTDTSGSRQIIQKEVSVGAGSQVSTSLGQAGLQRGTSSQTLLYVGIGIAAIIVVAAFFKFVKRKKK